MRRPFSLVDTDQDDRVCQISPPGDLSYPNSLRSRRSIYLNGCCCPFERLIRKDIKYIALKYTAAGPIALKPNIAAHCHKAQTSMMPSHFTIRRRRRLFAITISRNIIRSFNLRQRLFYLFGATPSQSLHDARLVLANRLTEPTAQEHAVTYRRHLFGQRDRYDGS